MSELTRKRLRKAFKMFLHDPREFYRDVRNRLRPMRNDYRRRFKMNLRELVEYETQELVFKKCLWMGFHAWKNPLDAWIYQEIVHETKPDVIIEIGGMEGGSTLYFANLLDLLGHGQVVSIDIDRSRFRVKHGRIVPITGSSSSPDVIARVFELCHGKSAMVVQDGAHDKASVLSDLRNYCKLVPVNGYFIVEDGIVDLLWPVDWYKNGPLAAVEQFLSENSDFVTDAEKERYLLTNNPQGFLKRIR